MRIRLRMIFILSLLIGLMGSQVFITIGMISHLTLTFADISEKQLVQIERINRINLRLINIMANPAGSLKSGSVAESRDLQEIESTITAYKKNYDGSSDKLGLLQDNFDDFKNAYELYSQQTKNGLPPGGNTLGSLQDSYFHLLITVNNLRDSNIQQVRDTMSNNYLVAKQTFYLLLIALSLVSVIGIVFGWYHARSFSKGLNSLHTAIRNVTQGDLSQPAHWNHPDEFGQLVKSFNIMLASLQRSRQELASRYQEGQETKDERIQILKEQLEDIRSDRISNEQH